MEKGLKFNSQVCTSVEQSRRLLDLGLKPETADMVYRNTNSRTEIMRWELKPYPPTLKSTTHLNIDKLNVFKHKNSDGKVMSGEEYFQELFGKDIPAWSLHRLIEMLPYTMTFRLKKHKITLYDICRTIPTSTSPGNTYYDALINAIEGLIDLGKFNKQYLNE